MCQPTDNGNKPTLPTPQVQNQLHEIRHNLDKVGITTVGQLVVGWWFHPVRFIADPVLGIAENVVAPAVTSVVPFSDPVAGFALSVTNNAGQLVHAVGAFVGIFMPADKSFGILKPEEMTEDELDIYVERCRALEISSLAWTTFGFAYGMLKDIFTLNVVKYWTWACALLKTNGFLWTSGIGVQLLATLPFFLSNAIILHKVQAIGREESTSAGTRPSKNTIDNGQYYMLYATATYGLAAMEAADDQKRSIMESEEQEPERKQLTKKTYASLPKKETDSMSEAFLNKFYRVRTPLEKATKKNISKHIGLEDEDDIIAMFVKPGGSMLVLRHFLAVDKKKKAVVLAIRGTFSVTGILIDTQAAGVKFLDGKAHEGIRNQANQIWDFVGSRVKAALLKYPKYDFIITGHSLGAGVACLLALKCESEKLVEPTTTVRCYSYASPPVFGPLENAPQKVVANTINYINDDDTVSFLSGWNIRQLLACMQAVGKTVNFWNSLPLLIGRTKPSPELIYAVKTAAAKQFPDKENVPQLFIPCSEVVWMRGGGVTEWLPYKASIYDPKSLPGIFLDWDMIADHFPPYYEGGFQSLTIKDLKPQNS